MTLHQAICDRCNRVESVGSPGDEPATWGEVVTPGESEDGTDTYLLCTNCLIQLSLLLRGANVRKPRTKTALGSSPLHSVDAQTP